WKNIFSRTTINTYIRENFSEEQRKATSKLQTKSRANLLNEYKYVDKLCLEENRDVFDLYRIESKIEKLLNKKVWLKSGGYLIIE
ncbi:ribonuclease E/G, partial [Clostridioides difficile]